MKQHKPVGDEEEKVKVNDWELSQLLCKMLGGVLILIGSII
jgi:hypothetical protein